MKHFRVITVLLAVAFTFIRSHAQTTNAEQLTVPLSNPGKAYTLKIRSLSGTIKITGYSGKDIVVDVNAEDAKTRKEGTEERRGLKRPGTDEDAANGMKRISSSGNYEVVAKENDNNVTITTNNGNKVLNLNLKIPQDVKIKVSTVSSAAVEIENVKGELEVSNTNGSIKLNAISGSVVANTTNGSISTSFVKVNNTAPMAFTSFNGNVSVTLPADTKANLKLNSERGDVYSDFDIDIDKTQPQVNTTKEPGVYKIKRDNSVYGKINGGGTEIFMKTYNGNVYVKKAGSKS